MKRYSVTPCVTPCVTESVTPPVTTGVTKRVTPTVTAWRVYVVRDGECYGDPPWYDAVDALYSHEIDALNAALRLCREFPGAQYRVRECATWLH